MATRNRIFYHITLKQYLPTILEQGLIPQEQHNPFWHKNYKAVFFWEDRNYTLELCCEAEVVLEVQIPKGIRISRRWDSCHERTEFRVCKYIPPIYLKVIQDGECH